MIGTAVPAVTCSVPRSFRMYLCADDNIFSNLRIWLRWRADRRGIGHAARSLAFVARLDRRALFHNQSNKARHDSSDGLFSLRLQEILRLYQTTRHLLVSFGVFVCYFHFRRRAIVDCMFSNIQGKDGKNNRHKKANAYVHFIEQFLLACEIDKEFKSWFMKMRGSDTAWTRRKLFHRVPTLTVSHRSHEPRWTPSYQEQSGAGEGFGNHSGQVENLAGAGQACVFCLYLCLCLCLCRGCSWPTQIRRVLLAFKRSALLLQILPCCHWRRGFIHGRRCQIH